MVQPTSLRFGYILTLCCFTYLSLITAASPLSSIEEKQNKLLNQKGTHPYPSLPIPSVPIVKIQKGGPIATKNTSSTVANQTSTQSTVIVQEPETEPTSLKIFPESLAAYPRHQSSGKPPQNAPTPAVGQVIQIQNLLRINSQLEKHLNDLRTENSRALEALHNSKSLHSTLRTQTSRLHRSSEQTRQQVELLHRRLPRYQDTLKILKSQATDAIRQIETLRTRKFYLLQRLRNLEASLRNQGLERWVGGRVKDSVNPLVADALMQGTASLVEPVLDGFGRIAEMEEQLEGKMKGQLRQRVPQVDNPFYSGFVTYLVLLTPIVLVLSILTRLRRSLAKMGLLHVIVLVNCYFAAMCAGCFGATLFGSVDVLLTLRAWNKRLFDGVMLLHGVLYAVYVWCHVVLACRVRSLGAVVHSGALAALGMHFFIHSWRHAMQHENPHVDRNAYLVYSVILGFVFYELTVKRVRDEQSKRVMTLNNSSIVGMTNTGDPAGAIVSPLMEKETSPDKFSLV